MPETTREADQRSRVLLKEIEARREEERLSGGSADAGSSSPLVPLANAGIKARMRMVDNKRKMVQGQPVLIVVDIQGGSAADPDAVSSSMPFMADYDERLEQAPAIVAAARDCGVPIVFFQEAHRRDLIDFGRELDGAEDIHLLEGDAGTEISAALGVRPDDYVIRKRRYSCFFGTELEILLKGLKADTLILIGGHTDVCVHYTFVDAHQHDYFCRVVEDCVAGSSLEAHEASLRAMEYLQTGARRTTAEVIAAFEEFKAHTAAVPAAS